MLEGSSDKQVEHEPGADAPRAGLEDARLLLMLAPWPAKGYNQASEAPHDQHLPENATVEPIEDVGSEQQRILDGDGIASMRA